MGEISDRKSVFCVKLKPFAWIQGVVDRNGQVTKGTAEDMLSDMAPDMNDGAKTLTDKIIRAAKVYNPEANVNGLQMQNEQEMQKNQGAPMI